MSFPPGTEMFQFPGFALNPLFYSGVQYLLLDDRGQTTEDGPKSVVRRLTSVIRRWVSPFGNPRIKASSQLPAAYRSVVRPSSPLSAKASTKCP